MRDWSTCIKKEKCVNVNAGFLTESDYTASATATGGRYQRCRKCQSAAAADYVKRKGLGGKGSSKKKEAAALANHTWDYKMASRYITSGFL